jgi:peptidylprolyl isomerase
MKMAIVIISVIVLGIGFLFLSNSSITGNVVNDTGNEGNKKVKLETNQGDIVIELDGKMPITAGNFEKLVNEGFYDGIVFHRVIEGFMIQGGDPKGDGTGGPGYNIEDEFNEGNRNDRGTISMANAGPNTGGSQFFINLVDNNKLDPKHPVFGKVVEGMEVVDAIGKSAVGAEDRPVEEVKILKASIV